MLEVYSVLLEHLKHSAHRTALVVNAVFFYVYRGEALASGYAGDGVGSGLVGVGEYERARVVGGVGVLYPYRDFLLHDGENRILVNDRSAHVGELAQLPVCDGLHDLRIIDNVRIGEEKARNVRPVLV